MVTAKVERQKLARRLGKKSEVVSFGFFLELPTTQNIYHYFEIKLFFDKYFLANSRLPLKINESFLQIIIVG